MDKTLVESPDGVGEAKFQDKKCIDRVRLLIKVEDGKISKADCIAEGCKSVRDAAALLVKSLKDKDLNKVKFDLEIKEKHAAEITKKAFERTLENYKKFKNDPLDEIVSLTQSYDEGYITRDPRYDFEY